MAREQYPTTRTAPEGGYWGVYASTGTLPNGATGVSTDKLTKGDTAYVDGSGLFLYDGSSWVEVLAADGTISGSLTATGTLTAADVITTDDVTVGDDLVVTGLATVGETLAVTGATTLTGGLVGTSMARISNIPIGGVARASIGTDAVHVAGTIYVSEIWIPTNKTITGIGVLNGTVVGTDKLIVGLYSSGGNLLANSALAGATSAGADGFQEIALTTPYAAVGPARYWIAVQCEGTTAATQRIAASTYLNYSKSYAGVFGTLDASLVPLPSSVEADAGPIGYVY